MNEEENHLQPKLKLYFSLKNTIEVIKNKNGIENLIALISIFLDGHII